MALKFGLSSSVMSDLDDEIPEEIDVDSFLEVLRVPLSDRAQQMLE